MMQLKFYSGWYILIPQKYVLEDIQMSLQLFYLRKGRPPFKVSSIPQRENEYHSAIFQDMIFLSIL